jgi:hypothetical protein
MAVRVSPSGRSETAGNAFFRATTRMSFTAARLRAAQQALRNCACGGNGVHRMMLSWMEIEPRWTPRPRARKNDKLHSSGHIVGMSSAFPSMLPISMNYPCMICLTMLTSRSGGIQGVGCPLMNGSNIPDV